MSDDQFLGSDDVLPTHTLADESAIAEAGLLGALAKRTGAPLSREELATETGAEGGERAIDVQVTRLRRKLEDVHGVVGV